MHPLSTRWPKSAAVLAVLALGACAPDQTVSTSPDVQDFASAARNTVDYSSVTLSGQVSLKVGTSTKLSVRTSSRSRGSIKWQSSNPSAATVNSQGNVTGQAVGSAYVTASGFAVNETYLVSVTPAYTLTSFTVSPTTGTALAPGQTRQFSTQQLWSDGQTRNFGVTYTATGGSISSSGLFTAGSVTGSFMVIANCLCGALDTAFVTVEVPAQLTRITVSPKTVSLNAGATQQFAATANWSTGATTLPPITWSATGGSISTSGLYTAPTTAGTYRVIVAHSGGTLRDTATVTVTGGVTTTPPPPTSGLMFFSDDFDNGRRNHANGFVWRGEDTKSNPRISSEMSYSGTHAMRFEFNASPFGGQAWAEERFDMGRYLSELAFEYMIFVPANYKHRDAPINGPGTNNKFFSLWRDSYGGDKGTWEISVGWSRTNDRESYALFHTTRSIHNWIAPFAQKERFIGANTLMRPGQWNRIRFFVKAATYRGTPIATPDGNISKADGIMKMWINDSLFFSTSTEDFNNFNPDVVGTMLRTGYLMGYANSGFDETTVFFIDAVKFYTGNPGW